MSVPLRILVADTPAGVEVFRRIFSGGHAIEHAHTLEQARESLRRQLPTLVVCGCHFDEGRMYDLLRLLKADPALAGLPFLAVRCVEGDLPLDGALYESVKIAVRALGGNAFVDLLRWQERHGEAGAGERFARLVETLADNPRADA